MDERAEQLRDGDHAPRIVESGRYVDGERVGEAGSSTDVSQPTEAPVIEGVANAPWVIDEQSQSRTITGPSDGIGTVAETGGNELTNAALIRDVSGLKRLGDDQWRCFPQQRHRPGEICLSIATGSTSSSVRRLIRC